MKLKTLTWNIGGGKLLQPGTDPNLMASYNVDGIDEIINFIDELEPDVITLQETEKSSDFDQVELIAQGLGFKYYYHQSISPSHIDTNSQLGNGIISRYPIIRQTSGLFKNPDITVTWEDGSIASTHDKGYITSIIDVMGTKVQVSTLHLTPFNRFGIELDSKTGQDMLTDISSKISISELKYILSGDFNIDAMSIKEYLPTLFEQGVEEIITNDATTPKDRTYDHVLYRGLINSGHTVHTHVLTDHYPISAEFEIE